MDRNEAILQAHAVCLFLEQPGGASMWDAIQQADPPLLLTMQLPQRFSR
jgi:hypothetical protein